MKNAFFLLVASFCLAGADVLAQQRGEFPFPEPPSMLSSQEAVAEWMALHFWDGYDFSAVEQKYSPQANHNAFVYFISVLYATTPELSKEAIVCMMNHASKSESGYWYFLEKAEMALYDPSSPMRNDLLWEVFLRHATGERSPLDELSKGRYASQLKLVGRNQQGEVATDFVYTLANGSQGRLHSIKSPLTVIYFYNPGCSECAAVKQIIDSTGYLEELHKRGLVQVLALHPDEDLSEWRSKLSENPKWWITAYDKGQKINREGLYDLKAIPTIYLLDAQKRVIMKDPTVEDFILVLEGFLQQ